MDLRSKTNEELDQLIREYVYQPETDVFCPSTDPADTMEALNVFDGYKIDQSTGRFLVSVVKYDGNHTGVAWGLDGFSRTACVAMLLACGLHGDAG